MKKLLKQATKGMSKQSGDINTKMAELDRKKHCHVTLKDIWVDYRAFKQSYYFHDYKTQVQRSGKAMASTQL